MAGGLFQLPPLFLAPGREEKNMLFPAQNSAVGGGSRLRGHNNASPRVFAGNPLGHDVYHPQVLVGSERSICDKSNSLHGARIWLRTGVDFSFSSVVFFYIKSQRDRDVYTDFTYISFKSQIR